jgi:hypothetical protein
MENVMEIAKDIYISLVVAGKLDRDIQDDVAEQDAVKPKFGRNWWYTLPNFTKTNIGWDFGWLCFLVSYDNYREVRKIHRQKDQKCQ